MQKYLMHKSMVKLFGHYSSHMTIFILKTVYCFTLFYIPINKLKLLFIHVLNSKHSHIQPNPKEKIFVSLHFDVFYYFISQLYNLYLYIVSVFGIIFSCWCCNLVFIICLVQRKGAKT